MIKTHAPNTNSLLAASIALSISKIPFLGPIGVIEIGRVNGNWIFNPTHPEQLASDMRIVVAGTDEGINMVEGSTNELSEKEFVDVMFQAHEKIKKQIAWQKEIQQALNYQETPVEDIYQFGTWKSEVSSFLTDDRVKRVNTIDKHERYNAVSELKKEFAEEYKQRIEESQVPVSVIDYIISDELQEKLSAMIFKTNKRVDGRDFDNSSPNFR